MENLRLRAAEQSMARKLQREKERTRRLVGEAEAAVSDHYRILSEYFKAQNEKRPPSHFAVRFRALERWVSAIL